MKQIADKVHLALRRCKTKGKKLTAWKCSWTKFSKPTCSFRRRLLHIQNFERFTTLFRGKKKRCLCYDTTTWITNLVCFSFFCWYTVDRFIKNTCWIKWWEIDDWWRNKKSVEPNDAPHQVFVKLSYTLYELENFCWSLCISNKHTYRLDQERKYKVQKKMIENYYYRVMFLCDVLHLISIYLHFKFYWNTFSTFGVMVSTRCIKSKKGDNLKIIHYRVMVLL